MKIQVSQKLLQDAVNKVQKFAPKKASVKSLEYIKVNAEDNRITLEATDLDTAIKVTVAGEIIDHGTILISPDKLLLLTPSTFDYQVTIADTEITAKNSVIKYQGGYPDDYPKMIFDCKTLGFTVTQKELLELLSVKYASAIRENRPIFNSIMIDKEHFVATDSHRLAQKKIPVESELEKTVLLPISAGKLLCGVLNKKSSDPVTCSVSKKNTQVCFTFGNTEIVSRQIDAEFPNWKTVTPHKFETTIKVRASDVLPGLKSLKTVAKVQDTLVLNADNEKFKITAGGPENKIALEFSAVVIGKALEGMGMSYKFLCDILTQQGTEDFELKANGKFSPLYVNGDIVLPVRMEVQP